MLYFSGYILTIPQMLRYGTKSEICLTMYHMDSEHEWNIRITFTKEKSEEVMETIEGNFNAGIVCLHPLWPAYLLAI